MTQILRHLGIISLVPEAVKKKSFSMLFRLNNFNWFIQVLEFQLLYVLILKLSFESYLFFWFPCQHFLFPFKSADSIPLLCGIPFHSLALWNIS